MTATRPVALVIGASSGIGQAAALAAAGFEVVGTSRDASRVAVSDGVTFLDFDVASDEPASTVVERFGRIDVLVNNAGVGSAGAAEELSVAPNQRVFDVNVFGVIRMTNAVLPHMRAPWARARHHHLVHQHPVRPKHGPNRHPYAGLRPATARLPRHHGNGDQGRRQPSRRRQR